MHRYLEMLGEDGILMWDGAGWEVREIPELGDPREAWQQLLARNPAFYAELTLLGRCGHQLAAILRGDVDPLHLIFPDGSLAIAEHLYQDSPSLRFYNTLVQRAVASFVEALPESRPLRVLEVGAGTGGMTTYVVPKLPADRTRYVYTDLSNHFFLKAEEKFKDYPFIEYKKLDIEQDPLAQGFEPQAFDLILASECLHATADLRQTLANVGRVLASDGLLLLLEAVQPVRWVDLVFGLTEGWWRFTDRDLRPSYPLLTFATWRTLLAEFGYRDVCEASGRPEVENAVIIARGPRVEPQASAAGATGVEAEPAPPASWLLFADDGSTGEALAQRLRARGDRCVLVTAGEAFAASDEERYRIVPDSPADIAQLLDRTVRAPGSPSWRGIVHLWNLDATELDEATNESLDRTMVAGCLSVVHLANGLAEVDASVAPRLWLVTRGAQSVGREIEATAAAQAAVWGLGRVVGNEVPKLRTVLVDLDRAGGDEQLDALASELVSDPAEDEIALRGQARYVHRYVRRAEREDSRAGRRTVAAGAVPFRLETSRRGTLDKLTLREFRRAALRPEQVEIRVAAAGLNFADVMKALGLYPGLAEGPIPLGIECSGTVAAVGDAVEDLKPGDEVVAIAPFAFGSCAVTEARFAARKPPQLSFEEAATLPIAYLTSHYALNYLGRMRAGERVLVHSATGGVGLAAIQLARRAGAQVFGTAGSPEKRDFLRTLGIEHVMDSRSVEFADEVLAATDGRGVDLVLNSLPGDAIRKGLSALGDYGRFLEIGKRDIYGNGRLGLRPFRKNLAFMAVDLDALMRQRPELLAELFRELMRWFNDGTLSPLPYRAFPISNVSGAFRYMAQAKHIGKVVVSLQEAEVAVAPPQVGEVRLRGDATYLMSGGLGGFGLTVARWLVDRGARHLVLLGRSGASTAGAQEAVEAMRNDGVQVVVAAADVTDREQVAAVLADIERTMPPLRGVLHAAMVLKDRLLADLNHERMHEVWSPKVNGAWNLHTLTLGSELDFFVMFSSLSSVFGIGGQANYASANAFMDSLAYYRRARGLPAVTVSWGYLGQVGWVARHQEIAERLEAQGVRSFAPAQALNLLGRFLQTDVTHVGVMNIDWRRWGAGGGSISPRFAELVRAGTAGDEASQVRSGSAARKALLAAAPDERRELMRTLLREQVARVLGAAPDKLDVERPLTDLGLDSLMAVELRNWIESDLRLSLPTVELMKGPSVSRLADVLLDQLAKVDAGLVTAAVSEIKPAAAQDDESVRAEKLLARVDELSDEQVDSLLEQMTAEEREAAS
jgi:NADPH:quinone reductase-like Zn-dependent oxidoreductase/SAM-dependent methyltransferase/acyl carrier protein